MDFAILPRIIVSLVLVSLPCGLLADDHIVLELTRSYRGNTSPKRVTEVWLAEKKACVKQGKMLFLYRFDLGKLWTVSPEKNMYAEEPLTEEREEPPAPEDTSLHRTGYDYEPRFDWSIKETGVEENLLGMRCRKVVADGEADYAQDSVELWIANESPVHPQWYYQHVLVNSLNATWKSLYKAFGGLKDRLVVKSRETLEGAIAGTIVTEREVTRAESGPPPERIYELPAGCTKAAGQNELYK